VEAEAVKFLWKRKHFEERTWKRKQTRKRLTLYGDGSGSKKYSTASTSLLKQSTRSAGSPYKYALLNKLQLNQGRRQKNFQGEPTEYTSPKNNTIKPISTLSLSCMKI